MGREKQADEEHPQNSLIVKAGPTPPNTFTFIVTVCKCHTAALFLASLCPLLSLA